MLLLGTATVDTEEICWGLEAIAAGTEAVVDEEEEEEGWSISI